MRARSRGRPPQYFRALPVQYAELTTPVASTNARGREEGADPDSAIARPARLLWARRAGGAPDGDELPDGTGPRTGRPPAHRGDSVPLRLSPWLTLAGWSLAGVESQGELFMG